MTWKESLRGGYGWSTRFLSFWNCLELVLVREHLFTPFPTRHTVLLGLALVSSALLLDLLGCGNGVAKSIVLDLLLAEGVLLVDALAVTLALAGPLAVVPTQIG